MPPPPLFRLKKEEMIEGRKAGCASKLKPGPRLSSKSGSATEIVRGLKSLLSVEDIKYLICTCLLINGGRMDKVARKLNCFGVCQSQKFGNKTQSKQNSQ